MFQDSLGDVVFAQLPEAGIKIAKDGNAQIYIYVFEIRQKSYFHSFDFGNLFFSELLQGFTINILLN